MAAPSTAKRRKRAGKLPPCQCRQMRLYTWNPPTPPSTNPSLFPAQLYQQTVAHCWQHSGMSTWHRATSNPQLAVASTFHCVVMSQSHKASFKISPPAKNQLPGPAVSLSRHVRVESPGSAQGGKTEPWLSIAPLYQHTSAIQGNLTITMSRDSNYIL